MSVRRVGLSRSLRPWGRVHGGDLLVQQLADGPLAAWPMQEMFGNNTVSDASGNSRDGASVSGSHVGRPPIIHGSGYSGGASQVTYAAWMKIPSFTAEIVCLAESTPGDNYGGFGGALMSRSGTWSLGSWDRANWTLYVGADQKPRASISTSTGTYNVFGSALTWVSTPRIVALTMSSDTAKIFVDGAEVASNAIPGTFPSPTATDNNLFFGTLQGHNAYPGWPGRLSHAAIYDRALSADEILRHAQVAGLA